MYFITECKLSKVTIGTTSTCVTKQLLFYCDVRKYVYIILYKLKKNCIAYILRRKLVRPYNRYILTWISQTILWLRRSHTTSLTLWLMYLCTKKQISVKYDFFVKPATASLLYLFILFLSCNHYSVDDNIVEYTLPRIP